MSVASGKPPLATFNDFKGLWSRGAYDTCPKDHLTDCHNCAFPGPGQLTIREPVSVSYYNAGRNIISYFEATNATTGPVLLTLSTTTSYNGLWAEFPIPVMLGSAATIAGTGGVFPDDFTAINIYGRTYISFKYLGKALPGGNLWYWDGTDNLIHAAGGAAPFSAIGPTLAQVTAGNVNAGWHGVAIAFLYRNGNISPPGNVTTINSTGSNDIELSSIDLPPLGNQTVVGRVVLMTQANTTSAAAAVAQLFFVPGNGGLAAHDITTTTAVINSYDIALIESADYLNDVQSPTLPSCSALRFYNGRLVLIGQDVYPDNILVSQQPLNGGLETINSVTGIVNVPADYAGNSSNTGFVINGVLYVLKPNGTFAVQDNGGDPSTWSVTPVDSALGAWDNATSMFSSTMSGSDISGLSFVATRKGLMTFNGAYSSQSLSYKIHSIWSLINPANFYKVQVAHDAWLKRVYVAVPLYSPSGFGKCNTSGYIAINYTAFLPQMTGLAMTINGVSYTVSSVDVTKLFLTLSTTAGIQTNVAWSLFAFVGGNSVNLAGRCNTNGKVVTAIVTNPSFYPGMAGMQISINNVLYSVVSVDPTLSYVTLAASPGAQTNVDWAIEYPGQPITANASLTTCNLLLVMDYSDGLDPMSVKWSTWSSVAFSNYVPGILKMIVENYGAAGSSTYQLTFCTGLSTVYRVLKLAANQSQVITNTDLSDSNPDGTAHLPINQFIISAPASSPSGVSTFTLIDMSVYGYGNLYPSAFVKNRTTQACLASFQLSNYEPSGQNLARLINITNEEVMIALQCDQAQTPSNGFFQLTAMRVFGNKMWDMRPSLTQST